MQELYFEEFISFAALFFGQSVRNLFDSSL
jgi:hypothetical protein